LANSLIRAAARPVQMSASARDPRGDDDPSPLIRSSRQSPWARCVGRKASRPAGRGTSDEHRLGRIRAGAVAREYRTRPRRAARHERQEATEELLASLLARPGYSGPPTTTSELLPEPERPPISRVGVRDGPRGSILASRAVRRTCPSPMPSRGQRQGRERAPRSVAIEANNARQHFNLGLLEGEATTCSKREDHLRRALATDPRMAPAPSTCASCLAERRPAGSAGAVPARPVVARPTRTSIRLDLPPYYLRSARSAVEAETTLSRCAAAARFRANGTLLWPTSDHEGRPSGGPGARTTEPSGPTPLRPEDRRRILAARAAFEVQAAREGSERGEPE